MCSTADFLSGSLPGKDLRGRVGWELSLRAISRSQGRTSLLLGESVKGDKFKGDSRDISK